MAASTPHTRKRTRATKDEKLSSSKPKAKPKSKSTSKSTSHQPSPDSADDDRDDDYQSEVADEENDDGDKNDAYDSDAIDEDDFVVGTKRKRGASSSTRSPKKPTTSSPRKKKTRTKKTRGIEEEDEDEDALELEDGQEVVGVVVQAPKTGQVPPGQISQNTFDFLTRLKDPECNDRQWFKLHEPVYRQAENEWKAFIDALTERITEADPQVPPLPPKDLIHRIYRDVRFSNDKTPYKKGFSASMSRSGRKGIWAGLKPGNESIIAAGSWCPGRNELANIRTNIQRRAGADRLRQVLSDPEFVAFFGEPRTGKDGARQSVFGMEDELKVAPKGVDKNHRFVVGDLRLGCVLIEGAMY
ncbi:hypothetical protein C0991_006650 [Blastosporella zonata]|nr:hypothetical protein C0991_006650 [Blastosporella zonata]